MTCLYEVEQLEKIIEARVKLTKGKAYPILQTGSQYIIPSEEVQEYLARADRIFIARADAFVINSMTHRLMAKVYLKFKEPKVPTGFFSSKATAIEWLKNYV